MKKLIAILLAGMLCVCASSCAKAQSEDTSTQDTTTTTERQIEQPIESTTKAPSEDSQKGEKLSASVLSTLGGSDISGDLSYGSFTYKNNRDAEIVYANERTDELEANAKDNAQKLVDSIKDFYGDEITYYDFIAKEIGSSENGIDSVRYQFYYINTQNQLLTIYADSDAQISYVDCEFTW
jgi:hypothetical protein